MTQDARDEVLSSVEVCLCSGVSYSRLACRAVKRAAAAELTPHERLALDAHLAAMGPAASHRWSMTAVGELQGLERAHTTRLTKRLVATGWLTKQDRGRIDTNVSRTAVYRPSPRLLALADQDDLGVTSRAGDQITSNPRGLRRYSEQLLADLLERADLAAALTAAEIADLAAWAVDGQEHT